jgi:DNA polymerase-3 subunit alpha
MGFAAYFLIVWDFVRYAREPGHPHQRPRVGVRGHHQLHAGDQPRLPAQANDLLFERFIDPSRNEPPDIDIDLCQERRAEVIAYVRQKYGEANVAQIGTFGTMGAKAALKDVGRAMDVPLPLVNALCKLVPEKPGPPWTRPWPPCRSWRRWSGRTATSRS